MISWRDISTRWAQRPVGAALFDTIFAAISSSIDRLNEAVTVLYPTGAPADALAYLALDRSTPTYTGEGEAHLRRRLRAWGTLLDGAGTLQLVARIAHLYHPGASRVVAVSRAQFYATSAAPFTAPVVAACENPWDWDSVDFTPLPPDRKGDVWVIVYPGDTNATFSAGDLTTLTDTGPLGFADATPMDLFGALSAALSAYAGAPTTVRCIVYAASNSSFDFLTPTSLPLGGYGRWRGRSTTHRYLDGD